MPRAPAPKSRYDLRKTPVQSRAKATVDAVLDAAARILVSEGYSQASTNRIAELAGVSIGSLYEYFPGKEAVFAELRRREGFAFYQDMVAEPLPRSPRAVIRHLVTSRIEWARRDPELYAALERQVPRDAVAEAERHVYEDVFTRTMHFLSEHRDQLRPAPDDAFRAEFVMRLVSSTVHDFAMASPRRLAGDEFTETLVDTVERLLLR